MKNNKNYVLWILYLEDTNRIALKQSADDFVGECDSSKTCLGCDKIDSCALIKNIMLFIKPKIVVHDNYDYIINFITELKKEETTLIIYLVNTETHIGYLYKSPETMSRFKTDTIVRIHRSCLSFELPSLEVSEIKDVRDIPIITNNIMN